MGTTRTRIVQYVGGGSYLRVRESSARGGEPLKRPRDKGSAGEREVCELLNARLSDFGCSFARVPLSGSGALKGDVFDKKHKSPFHIEVKRQERLNVLKAYEQSCGDAEEAGQTPVLIHRVNRGPWLITLALDDWMDMAAEGLDEKRR